MPERTRIAIAVGALLTSTAAMLAMHIAMPSLASAHEDHGHFSAGQPGDPKKPARVINIKMFEGSGKMGYEPARIEVRRGEQVRFVLRNDGEEDHEFILATVPENRKKESRRVARPSKRETRSTARKRRDRLEVHQAR